ncbi:hypothetical protein HNQ94_002835 [Salirhabdus euzebyi]|uniref:DUF1510 domain-containing protein n=1 Tax=Salirhabdus euzebyi TaxID=394506 RepID=A0A841Q7G2_9BACI|nr:YrrS family protein [Salirhabdus euzebyi]MBB6454360.1 hypothetical protein [Salirhabdus euzebyi]
MSNSFFDEQSRVNKFEKRRKNTKWINTFIVLGCLLGIYLAFTVFFNDDDQKASVTKEEENDQELSSNDESVDTESPDDNAEEDSSDDAPNDDSSSTENSNSNNDNNNKNDDTTQETSSDENVSEVIVKSWEPIGTEQDEPHVTTYEEETVDWEEMWSAARYATGLSEGDTIRWWVTNGGDPQKVVTTITNKAQTEIYRVYIQWVSEQGWQPTKVEVLKENDQADRFKDDTEEEAEEQQEE